MQDDDDSGDADEELKVLQAAGSFDEVMLWGHESVVPEDDAFVKGIGEWIHFAEIVGSDALLVKSLLSTQCADEQAGTIE